MIVHPPELRVRAGTLRLSVRIQYEKGWRHPLPEVLWIEMPAAQERYLSARMDSWAAKLLVVAMRRAEPLTLRGTLSDQLAHGLVEYQRAITGKRPKEVRQVPICAAAYESVTGTLPAGVGLPFSGGVDSFYTFWAHIPPQENSPAHTITHGVFLQGVDIGYGEEATMRACVERYSELFASMGKELLTLRTNIRDFYPEGDWGWIQSPDLASVGLLFGNLFRRFYIAAGATYGDWLENGYPLFDQFFSTETLDIVNDGAGVTRVDKVAHLASWQPVRDTLRVCFTKPDGLNNCCRCPKCLHALACLDLAGELGNFKTFPLGYTRARLRGARFAPDLCSYVNDTRKRALQLGRRDLAFDLSWVIAASVVSWSGKRARQEIGKRVRPAKKS